jgi:Spy/CpxP family protein refolding chaperone
MIRNRALSLALFTLLAAPVAFSQQAPPAPSPAPAPPAPRDTGRDHQRGPDGGGMGIVPPGTWWRSPNLITALTLTADQQKRLDDIFLQSRISLIRLHASLEEEQLKLEPLLNANPPDQGKSLAEISKIADLRAELEKADAKMLLSLRAVLTADQWTKLQAEQHGRHDDRGARRGGPGGPSGQGGPNGPPGQGAGPRSSVAPMNSQPGDQPTPADR